MCKEYKRYSNNRNPSFRSRLVTKNMFIEVLTAVVMKSTIFWDITPCSPLSVNRRFGGTYRLHLHGRKNKLSKKPARKQMANWFLAQCIFFTLKMEAIFYSETWVDTQLSIPEDGTLRLKS
jgi:hypothetical protein